MINTRYKDRLFSFIFGRPERKDWTLSLYNAVNESSYTILIANKAEVKQMCITEYNEAETMEQFREEGREENREETAIIMLKDNLELDKVVRYSGLSKSQVMELQKTLKI